MRYTATEDGVRVAFATAGEGASLVRIPSAPFSHCQLEWKNSDFYDHLSRGRKVVTFDPRGTGLSDRDVSDFSLEKRLMDVDAVVDHLGLDTFAINGVGGSGPVAITYAVRHPERVSHLILDDTYSDGRTVWQPVQSRAFRELSGDWEAITEQGAFIVAGTGAEEAQRYAEFLRACTTHENALRMWSAFRQVDVTDLLPSIQAPTLIMQHTGIRGFSADHARQMATLIPNAQLVLLEGRESDDLDHLLSVIGEFLGDQLPYDV